MKVTNKKWPNFPIGNKNKVPLLCSSIVAIVLILILFFPAMTLKENNDIPEKPLELEIRMEKNLYASNETINITVVLTNIGNTRINVSEMDLGLGPHSIDFEIVTPDGHNIRYTGPIVETMPHGITLEPDEEYSRVFTLTPSFYPFPFPCWGNDGINDYDFTTPGEHSIRGVYTSNPARCFDASVWDGTLYSNILFFTIETAGTNMADDYYYLICTHYDNDGYISVWEAYQYAVINGNGVVSVREAFLYAQHHTYDSGYGHPLESTDDEIWDTTVLGYPKGVLV